MANPRLNMRMTRFPLPRNPAREVNSGMRIVSKNDPIAISEDKSRMVPPVMVLLSILQNESAEYDAGFGGNATVTKRDGKKKPMITSADPRRPIKLARRREDKRGIRNSLTNVSDFVVNKLRERQQAISRGEYQALDENRALFGSVL